MHIDILSLYPDFFEGPLGEGILKRAIDALILTISPVDIRLFSKDKHKKVDDRPFGGGPGMVLTPQPTLDAIRSRKKKNSHLIYLSPQGKLLTAERCQELAQEEHLILLCGHYEGIDERIIEKEELEEISIGDYILTSGCLPALVLADAVARFLPGVLGDPTSAYEDSFQKIIFDGPNYTRPEIFEEMRVPSILLGGNHEKIAKWRWEKGLEKTQKMRPDLYERYLKEQVNLKGVKNCETES